MTSPTTVIDLTRSLAGIVTGIGACVVDALNQTPAGAPSRQCLLLPTQSIPWDNCDCGGQVAQAIQSVYGSTRFPSPVEAKDWQPCGPPWRVAQVVVQVTRCVPTMDEQGVPPPCSASLLAAYTLEDDRTAVAQALACCLTELKTAGVIGGWSMEAVVTVGEQGGCAGVEVVYRLSVRSCLCGIG